MAADIMSATMAMRVIVGGKVVGVQVTVKLVVLRHRRDISYQMDLLKVS